MRSRTPAGSSEEEIWTSAIFRRTRYSTRRDGVRECFKENEGHEHVWDLESQAKSMLNRLGIPDFNEKVEHLSGGQKKRAALASVLLSTAEL